MATLLIIIPLMCVIVINLPFLRFLRGAAFWLFALFCIFQGAYAVLPLEPSYAITRMLESLFVLHLSLDRLTLLLLFIIALVALTAAVVTREAADDDEDRFRLYNLFFIVVTGLNGVVMINDLFSMYVFLEVAALTSFILIASGGGAEHLEGAFKYLILSALATAALLSSIALIFLIAGDLSFAPVRAAFADNGTFLARFAAGLFMCALFVKGGLVLFHWWLPDAYEAAPAPVSIILGGIITKVVGVYTLIRLFTGVFPMGPAFRSVILFMGGLSILAGALLALRQHDFKRMLAYSSISQVGYIILGLGAGTPLGIAGAMFHFFNHAVFKSTLFVNAAALESVLGTREMERMGGLSVKMPWTGGTSLVAFLSAAGFPPLAGFWSKLVIVLALWQAHSYGYAAVAVFGSVITMGYFLVMQRNVFFGKLREGLEFVKEAPFALVAPAVVLSLITIGAGILYGPMMERVFMPIGKFLLNVE